MTLPTFSIIAAFIIGASSGEFRNIKINKTELQLLAMIPLTGKEPANGKACTTAMQIVVDSVNANPDILPNYRLTLNVQDEARNANRASFALIRYMDPYFDNQPSSTTNGNVLLSPVVLGPSITCQYVNVVAKHLLITQFSQFCAGPYLVNRQVLPNLFRVQIPGEYSIIPILLFMQRYNWHQLAIFTYSLNVNEYMMAKQLSSTATVNGIEVVHYASEDDVTLETVTLAKASGARVYALIYLQVAMCVRFLCNSYRAGMRAPHYIFLAQIFCYFTADSPILALPPGCTREMVYEQMKITYWAGIAPTNSGTMPPFNTTFGYDVPWFEGEIRRRLNNSIAPDDDQRHLCHDTAGAAITTIDKGEHMLKERYNMTIGDFRRYPKLVADVFNETATKTDFVGVRIGRIKYSSRFELAEEDMWIMQWSNGEILRFFRVKWRDLITQQAMYNLSSYTIERLREPVWMTKTSKPPKDLSQLDRRLDGYSESTTAVVVSISVVIAVGHIFIAVLSVIVNKGAGLWCRIVDLTLALGCLLLDAAAIMMSAGAYSIPTSVTYCRNRVVLPILGVSIIDGIIFTRIFMMSRLMQSAVATQKSIMKSTRSKAASSATKPTSPNKPSTASSVSNNELTISVERDWRLVNKVTSQNTGVITLISVVLLFGWLLGSTEDFTVETVISPVMYDEPNDSFYTETTHYCKSDNLIKWLGGLIGLHASILLAGVFFAYEIGKVKVPPVLSLEVILSRLSMLNALTIFLAFLMITFILSTHLDTQITILAVGFLLYSLLTSLIWFFPTYRGTAAQLQRDSTLSIADRFKVRNLPPTTVIPVTELNRERRAVRFSNNTSKI